MSAQPDPCVCGHDADEHQDQWGCVTERHISAGYAKPCLCTEYEPDEIPF